MVFNQKGSSDTKQRLRQLLLEISGVDHDYDDPVAYAEAIRDYYENILTHLPYNVYWKDQNLVYQGCNKQMASVVGLLPDDIKGQTDKDLVWKNEASILNQVDREVIDNETKLQVEETVQLADGRKQTYLSNKVPLYRFDNHTHQVMGLVGISVNIEPLKRLEKSFRQTKHELELANKAKNILTSKITHDIRNPLSSILMMARNIQEGSCDPEEQAQYISAIITCSQQLLDLVRNLLESGKQGEQALTINDSPFNLRALMRQIENELSIRARQDQTQYRVHFDPQIPARLMGDAMQLRRVLYNLSDNALKFTKQGYVDVYVDFLEWTRKNELTLQFQVKDTGLGIPKSKLMSIFGDYEQLSSQEHMNSTSKWGGVGLGLAIVQELVQAMGGQVHVESEVGRGTNFWFNLNFTKAPADDVANVEQGGHHSNQQLSSSRARLLIVEDEAISLQAISHLCKNQNCQVDTASNEREALEQLNHYHYDLVLMDMFLGNEEGIEVVKRYWAEHPTQETIPTFYALTANSSQEQQQACIEAGMQGVIVKPLTKERLNSILDSLTNN